MIHMGMRMLSGTSFTSAHSALSWPKNTDWVTLIKEASVITDTISATTVTKA